MLPAITTTTPADLAAGLLAGVMSPATRRSYERGLRGFLEYSARQGQPLSRDLVQRYMALLDADGMSPATINQALTAIKALANEARERGLSSHTICESICSIHGLKQRGVRVGNWLSRAEAERLISAPDVTTPKGKRDQALLSLLIGCALRRAEVSALTRGHLQFRDGRPAIVDIIGKGRRVRSVGIPWKRWPYTWEALSVWLEEADGPDVEANPETRVFRQVNKAGRICSDHLTVSGIWRLVTDYSAAIGAAVAPHDLRRTHAAIARRGGATLEQIQTSLGHSNLVTTQRYLGAVLDLADSSGDHL